MSSTVNIPSGSNLYSGYGTTSSNSVNSAIKATRAPTSTDLKGPQGNFPIGQRWIDTSANGTYTLTSVSASNGVLSATWVTDGGGSGALSQLTGSTGTATPTSGSIQIAGTANQVTTEASGSTVTLSTPSTFVAPGTITATLGAITATNGNLVLGTAGNKLSIATGANASMGTATMSGVTVTVNTTAVTVSSLIFLSFSSNPAVSATLYSTNRVAGTSFDIITSDATGTPTVNWWIVN